MAEDELVRRILSEADMAARPGQYDRLVAIANEVAALRERPGVFDVGMDSLPSQTLMGGIATWRMLFNEEVVRRHAAEAEVRRLKQSVSDRAKLADLRAKVEGLPYRTWVPPHATDCPGRPGKRGICTCGDSLRASDWMLRADVLALIEEAE